MLNLRRIATALGLLGATVAVAASPAVAAVASTLPQGSEPVQLDPADFSTQIDNPYFPLVPGDRYIYRETDSEGAKQRVVVSVTNKTKQIANGITARVVHDRVTEHGKVVEDTFDWYAQDADGNVWYLGEDTVECKKGKIKSHSGAFEAGVDGAQPGVIMPADPEPGLQYRQEYYAGKAEDKAEIVSLHEQAEVPFGHFPDTLMTKDLNPLEPKVSEFKFYAKGVGAVLAVAVSGGTDREELVKVKHGKKTNVPSQSKRCVVKGHGHK
jgi:hypothetical protein